MDVRTGVDVDAGVESVEKRLQLSAMMKERRARGDTALRPAIQIT
jgi:hypothetical protein